MFFSDQNGSESQYSPVSAIDCVPRKTKICATLSSYLPTFSKRSIFFSESGNSVVGIATRLGAGRQRIESRQGRELLFCPQRPDRLCEPPSLLSNGYWAYFLEREFQFSPVSIAIEWSGIAQSVQRLATGRTIRESNLGGGEIFLTRPDRPWGPPSLLYNGYRIFPGSKAAGAWR